ncbi:putative metallophosphoesterase YunD [Insulibacter thermoxylanivorax]|uniref:Metallophosphoesterase YunD n=1 Tax=Insulibacter thermoxylanivorax TaxID=2749268 RepID=A0A916VG73_9BACL|nr:bifunctional UDP-sugar hydrolase/5'-nucleotidase [Insulibacter thermoxylanivorax]GFR38648.1 putative metallophosphoesterase YunD [Insulibacter thermoxylanivorax]
MSESMQRLVILHTNDIHSHFEPMPRIASLIERYRREVPADELLVIDCGDHMDRAYVETEGSDGQVNIAVMNATGYDLAVPGNNEGLTFSRETLQRLYEQADFPVIGSNMHLKDSGEIPAWLKPFMIIQRGNLKIGIIGVTIDFTDFYELLGWDIRDPYAVTSQLVAKLRDQVDILVVVSHLGINYDKRMAQVIPGIDCILGAHTHHLLEEPLVIGQTTICGAGKFGTHVGKLEIFYDHDAKRIVSCRGACEETSGYPESREILAIIDHYRTIAEKNLRQVVTTIPKRLAIDWYGESELGNLLAIGLKEWCGAEVGLVNAGQLLDSLEAGAVTRGRLLEICPSPINPCKMILTGREIREALEQSLLREYQAMPIRGYGFRGEVLGTLCVSGLQIEVDHAKPEMHKIQRILIRGKELADEQEVVVGTIDMFTFGLGYLSLSRGREIEYYMPEFLRDVLMNLLDTPEHIALSAEKHWIRSC